MTKTPSLRTAPYRTAEQLDERLVSQRQRRLLTVGILAGSVAIACSLRMDRKSNLALRAAIAVGLALLALVSLRVRERWASLFWLFAIVVTFAIAIVVGDRVGGPRLFVAITYGRSSCSRAWGA